MYDSSSLFSSFIDGTTSSVIFTGELLKQAERFTTEGLHPRLITEGYEIAKDMVLDFLESFKVSMPNIFHDREMLTNVVKTSLRTKLALVVYILRDIALA